MERANGHGQTPSTQIVPAAPAPVAMLELEETAEQFIARATRQVRLHEGIVKLIAANISPKQVMLFGENIWLTKEACLRVLGWIGADISPEPLTEHRYEGGDGPYIEFDCWGSVTLPSGRTIRAMGNSSTLDDFFAKENSYICAECGGAGQWRGNDFYCTRDNKKVRYEKASHYKPLTEIDIPSVRQKAVTNFFNHALQIVGAMPTKDELVAAGMNLGDAAGKVEFSGGSKPSQQSPAQKTGQAPRSGAAAHPTPQPHTVAPSTPQPAPMAPPRAEIPDADKWINGNSAASQSEKSRPQPAPSAPPVQRPSRATELSRGVVSKSYLNNGKNGQYMRLEQDGKTLYCFQNTAVETVRGQVRVFDLLKDCRGKVCEFIVSKNNRGYVIEGARAIGEDEWDDQGYPLVQREPGT